MRESPGQRPEGRLELDRRALASAPNPVRADKGAAQTVSHGSVSNPRVLASGSCPPCDSNPHSPLSAPSARRVPSHAKVPERVPCRSSRQAGARHGFGQAMDGAVGRPCDAWLAGSCRGWEAVAARLTPGLVEGLVNSSSSFTQLALYRWMARSLGAGEPVAESGDHGSGRVGFGVGARHCRAKSGHAVLRDWCDWR
jgi:hypothetical protein